MNVKKIKTCDSAVITAAADLSAIAGTSLVAFLFGLYHHEDNEMVPDAAPDWV